MRSDASPLGNAGKQVPIWAGATDQTMAPWRPVRNLLSHVSDSMGVCVEAGHLIAVLFDTAVCLEFVTEEQQTTLQGI